MITATRQMVPSEGKLKSLRHDSFADLCRARELLGVAPDAPLSIAEVAREARLSPFHFICQFVALFGVTPHQYRIRARLDRAKALLAQGNMTVTEVCMDVGMSSLGSFSDQFTRSVGCTPSDFQRKARGNDAMFPGCLSLMGMAFRNSEEAQRHPVPVESTDANQTHQSHGR